MPLGIAIVLSLYSKIKPILPDSVKISPYFRIRTKSPPRRQLRQSLALRNPTPQTSC